MNKRDVSFDGVGVDVADEQPDALDVRGLEFSYGAGSVVLKDVTFRVRPAEKVALLGSNGAGKSTLLLHLNGLLRGRGDIRVCGTRVEEATHGVVRAMLALVFQDPDDQLFSATVFEDVAFGPLYMGLGDDEVRERVHTALAAVGLDGFERRVPWQLSGGEKKRAAIATVLSMAPRVLALDEPTAGLDPSARRKVIGLLRSLPHAMLIATHDLEMVRELCARTLVLHTGSLVADGDTRALLADRDLLERYGLAD